MRIDIGYNAEKGTWFDYSDSDKHLWGIRDGVYLLPQVKYADEETARILEGCHISRGQENFCYIDGDYLYYYEESRYGRYGILSKVHMRTLETEIIEEGIKSIKYHKKTMIVVKEMRFKEHDKAKVGFVKISVPDFQKKYIGNLLDVTKKNCSVFWRKNILQQYDFNENYLVWILRKDMRRLWWTFGFDKKTKENFLKLIRNPRILDYLSACRKRPERNTLMITNLTTGKTNKIKEWNVVMIQEKTTFHKYTFEPSLKLLLLWLYYTILIDVMKRKPKIPLHHREAYRKAASNEVYRTATEEAKIDFGDDGIYISRSLYFTRSHFSEWLDPIWVDYAEIF